MNNYEGMKLIAKAINNVADAIRDSDHSCPKEIDDHGTAIERGCLEIAEALGELGIQRQAD